MQNMDQPFIKDESTAPTVSQGSIQGPCEPFAASSPYRVEANPAYLQPSGGPIPSHSRGGKGWIMGLVALIISIITLGVVLVQIVAPHLADEDVVSEMDEPTFHIENFVIEKEVTDYTYTEDSVSYDGEGEVVSSDTTHDYEVLLEITLVSGGAIDSEEVYYTSVMVVDGKGIFYTYEYGDVSDVDKPVYNFRVIGYQRYENLSADSSVESGGDSV